MHLTQSWTKKEWAVCGLLIGIIVVLAAIGLIIGPKTVAMTVLIAIGVILVSAPHLDELAQGFVRRFNTREVR